MEEEAIDPNTLDEEEFMAYLAAHNYDEVEALEGTLDDSREIRRIKWCLDAQTEFDDRFKASLNRRMTGFEIKTLVKELSVWTARGARLKIVADNFVKRIKNQ